MAEATKPAVGRWVLGLLAAAAASAVGAGAATVFSQPTTNALVAQRLTDHDRTLSELRQSLERRTDEVLHEVRYLRQRVDGVARLSGRADGNAR